MKTVLCLFTRTPKLGLCKTRLTSALGNEGALAAHIELVEDQIARLSNIQFDISLWVTERSDRVEEWARLLKAQTQIQYGNDLGERMMNSFTDEFDQGADRVCLIGGDCPDITQDYVFAAIDGLQDNAVVVGPTEDGGYGLIALRKTAPSLFRQVRWSTEHVLADTLQIAAKEDLSVKLLDEIWDVDMPEDWQRYCRDKG
jgi:rSAM/selenodomain-associated transferase 1